ncbi:hypothetical protein CLAFUW4_07675 [Fulvia fulva]|uniref:Uncharacterized protein n=1 Tax=Passalora fulva TaxID=5499 RepID=A0A9Q8P722_PASFU|nr:uncharacterized protein CLAFUR5_07804 [Fulvia fulva]KAK4629282.1 hypothetical protein CLAFUR4_07680 [Fulvia fulva]KAK4630633.1 hypothetical protein CLAFUR0_07680 [Fulvia fulva]UJO15629.1 hypothetical protein CLAFUR5_07804 [Fulvia fulva]WPV12333.1 hypothetical protein CLAFUW4_07675 [Fulvia fulva]WPV27495.1 hypothetical protein CLAFUW7_07676 [Fulvia fulva]
MPPDPDIEKQTSRSSKSNDVEAAKEYTTVPSKYRNSLLAAVAYLDLANALDFPANVWNQVPTPLYAKVLMGIGGSIAILSTSFAFWDMVLAWRNITFLRTERRGLKQMQEKRTPTVLEQAWMGVNTRELGWEVIDRMMLNAFMAIAGILVGTGCLMAIRGDIPSVFLGSNIMSGYLGNSFVALYAVINTVWCIFMWKRAHACEGAVKRAGREIGVKMMIALKSHSRRHKIYAIVNGVSILASGIGSEISSTMWPGYEVESLDVRQRLSEIMEIREALVLDSAASIDCCEPSSGVNISDDSKTIGLMHDLGLELDRAQRADVLAFGYEERFLLELYGYFLLAREQQVATVNGRR